MDAVDFRHYAVWLTDFLFKHGPRTPLPQECKELLNAFVVEKKARGEELSDWLKQLMAFNGVKGE